MIVLGVILLILGVIFGISILTYIGVVLIVIGAVFWILGSSRPRCRRPLALVLASSRRFGRPGTGPRSSSPARSRATRNSFLGRPIWLCRA